MPIRDPDVGIAFGVVCAAGASTALGASVVFFPKLVRLASPRVLASGLGVSAGVMVYVSFVEIFPKAQDYFEDSGKQEKDAFLYTTLCFFSGVLLMILLDLVVHCLAGGKHHHHHKHDHETPAEKSQCAADMLAQHDEAITTNSALQPHHVTRADDPVGDLEIWQHIAKHRQQNENEEVDDHDPAALDIESDGGLSSEKATPDPTNIDDNDDATVESVSNRSSSDDVQKSKQKLVAMGLHTALAIALHNFPEGLATFVTTLDDPKVGAILAIAIGIHNIPEGLCVALPIYYATGQRWKAFLYACISGISEPIAALLGWIVLAKVMTETVFAVLFGVVGGMMVIISVKELIPTAHRYDPDDKVVTYSFIGGMFVLALSLVLFLM